MCDIMILLEASKLPKQELFFLIFHPEIFIAGLREFLGPYNVTVHVSKLAKYKTAIQMVVLGFLIAGEHGELLIPYANEIGHYGLVVAMLLTVYTGWTYLKVGFKTIQEIDKRKPKK